MTLAKCERFSLFGQKWSNDVPDLNVAKFGISLVVVAVTWLYSFGGQSDEHQLQNLDENFEIERLNT